MVLLSYAETKGLNQFCLGKKVFLKFIFGFEILMGF